MEDYKNEYLFLIATLEHLQKEIAEELNNLNYKHYCGISNLFYAEIREKINDFTPDILQKLNKGLCNLYDNFICLDKKINNLSNQIIHRIEEQNEICAVNEKAFLQYENCFYRKEVVLMATGPTVNQYVPIKDAIHIGVNSIYKKKNLPLDFLFVQDARRIFLSEGKFDGIEKVKCKVFIGRILYDTIYEEKDFPEQYRLPENVKSFFVDGRCSDRIYRDIAHHSVEGKESTVFSALHFALYTFPKRIYLVGCDVSPQGYFDGTVDQQTVITDEREQAHLKRYQIMKEWAEIHYPETEIISINPVGLKGMFKEIYTE